MEVKNLIGSLPLLLRVAQGALPAQHFRKRMEAMLFLHNKCMKDLNSGLCLPRAEGSYLVKQVGPSLAVLPLLFQAIQFGRVKLRGQTGCFFSDPSRATRGKNQLSVVVLHSPSFVYLAYFLVWGQVIKVFF